MIMMKKIKRLLLPFQTKKLDLINETKSPLFRIMSVFNYNEPARRRFANNICAFHIGNGFIISVAHNLRAKEFLPPSLPENIYQNEVLQNLNQADTLLFDTNFLLDPQTNKRYINTTDQAIISQLTQRLNSIRFDSRYVSMYNRSICKPFLIIQFRVNSFYNNLNLTARLNNNIFHEPALSRYTFIFELELINAFYNQDIALYRLVDMAPEIINKIPSIKLDFEIYDKSIRNFFCLQSAPVSIGFLGRLLNDAKIEGVLDHWSEGGDSIAGNYIIDGLRYLIRGYFRFGSSGAPYLIYSHKEKEFKVNAIQSQASPIQLAINNNLQGNLQYVNAIASPLKNIENELKDIIRQGRG